MYFWKTSSFYKKKELNSQMTDTIMEDILSLLY